MQGNRQSVNKRGLGASTVAAALLIGWLAALLGCQAAPRDDGPVRAIWVTRFDYRTAEDIKRIIGNCAEAGFNTVMFQVRGHGTAHYRSKIEPWAQELGGSDPGFDPLELAVQEAHARQVRLHAWVNVVPAWRGAKPPTDPNQLYNKRAEWFWYDQEGKRQALSSFYVSVNPCLPEVREYLVDVLREVLSRYEVDGLHLDYLRFPNEPPAVPRGSKIDYPRDEKTLALFRTATGKAPDDDPEAWNRWRTEQVTRLTADVRAMQRRTRPTAVLSVAVGAVRDKALTHFQDAQAWIEQGLLDWVMPMNYVAAPADFKLRLEPWMQAVRDRPVRLVSGLSIGAQQGKPPLDAALQVQQQIEIAREASDSYCIFAYASLFDSPSELEGARAGADDVAERRQRREAILPAIRRP